MGEYRATINMAGARVGQTATFDDDDLNVRRMVASRFLVPVDEAARAAQDQPLSPEEKSPISAQEKIKAALAAARAQAPEVEASSDLGTAVAVEQPAPEEEDEAVEAPVTEEDEAVVEESPKRRLKGAPRSRGED